MSLFSEPPPDNVIEFKRRDQSDSADDVDGALARAPRAECRHQRRLIDAEQREVHCRECGQKLDPIWCLLNLADYHDAIERKLIEIRAHDHRMKERQARTIALKQRRVRRSGLPAAGCVCGGTAWLTVSEEGKPPAVKRCTCRATGAPRLL